MSHQLLAISYQLRAMGYLADELVNRVDDSGCTLPVCSQCGERYYNPRAMGIIENIRAKSKKKDFAVEEVGRILRPKSGPSDFLLALAT